MSRRNTIADAVADKLRELGATDVKIENGRAGNHPRVWFTRGSVRRKVFVPGSPGDRRSIANNVAVARRVFREAT